MAKISNAVLDTKVEAYLKAKQELDELTKQLDFMKNELKAIVKETGGDEVLTETHKLTLSQQTRTAIDYKAFSEAHPKLAAKFSNTTSYEVFRVK